MGKRIKLRILGLTYSQTQTGSYALVLAEVGGDRRIPIMIGAFEAQAIALHLEELHPPRPLTHDLFRSFAQAYNVRLKEVIISKLEEGIFYSELFFHDGESTSVLDSRTSDAVALALRFKCPIYTTEAILDKAGIVLDESVEPADTEAENQSTETGFKRKTDSELKELLKEAVAAEDYERASEIQEELNRRGLSRG